ncbi:MAG TPA: S24 family peptidase [Chloroflexi bacterium]|nr:S24 family peptidase [Chloroflexota bacterium]
MQSWSPLDWLRFEEVMDTSCSSEMNLALELYYRKEFDRAEKKLTEILEELEKTNPSNYEAKGCVRFCLGEVNRNRLPPDFFEAARLFREAADDFRNALDLYRQGISLRMEGFMLSLIGCYDKAVICYKEVCYLFHELWRMYKDMRNTSLAHKFEIWWQELSLLTDVMQRIPSIPVTIVPPPTAFRPAPVAPAPALTADSMELHFLPLLTSIAAGEGYILNAPPQPEDYLVNDEVILENKRLTVSSLIPGTHQVKITRGFEYFIARVKGNSMNRASPTPINDGDYVIIKVAHFREGAEGEIRDPTQLGIADGDIVAVKLSESPDEYGILKRFEKRLDSEFGVLVSESTDSYPEIEFDPSTMVIIGKAIAVLKEKAPEPEA